jgi:uncharacterized protein (DUF433 family)
MPVIFVNKKTANAMYVADRITVDPDLCNGKPTIRGLRVTVQTILEYVTAGDSREDILYQYPMLEPADIDACLQFAVRLMDNHYVLKPLAKVA